MDWRRCRRRPMLGGEHEVFLDSPQVEIGIAEGVDVAGAAKPLAGGGTSSGVLAGVMHQHHRDVELPLQRAKVGQQRGHFAGIVLVDGVQSHQRIQQHQPGPQPPGGLQEAACGAARGPAGELAR